MPGWDNAPRPRDWRGAETGYSNSQAILDLATVHNLWTQIQGWKDGDPSRKLVYAKIAAAHERLIDLVGQS